MNDISEGYIPEDSVSIIHYQKKKIKRFTGFHFVSIDMGKFISHGKKKKIDYRLLQQNKGNFSTVEGEKINFI